MNEKNRYSQDPYNVESSSVNDLDGCATTEATGLIPALPANTAQIDSYKEILPYSPDCYVEKSWKEQK